MQPVRLDLGGLAVAGVVSQRHDAGKIAQNRPNGISRLGGLSQSVLLLPRARVVSAAAPVVQAAASAADRAKRALWSLCDGAEKSAPFLFVPRSALLNELDRHTGRAECVEIVVAAAGKTHHPLLARDHREQPLTKCDRD